MILDDTVSKSKLFKNFLRSQLKLEVTLCISKVISKRYKLVKLCHINRRGPFSGDNALSACLTFTRKRSMRCSMFNVYSFVLCGSRLIPCDCVVLTLHYGSCFFGKTTQSVVRRENKKPSVVCWCSSVQCSIRRCSAICQHLSRQSGVDVIRPRCCCCCASCCYSTSICSVRSNHFTDP